MTLADQRAFLLGQVHMWVLTPRFIARTGRADAANAEPSRRGHLEFISAARRGPAAVTHVQS